ncbi:hypothetical protein ACIQRE_01645 [Streptomyces griseoluteus]|uniref:hypothetical protein n=1 Tax=Streptomyces griseoluteus TaxID=29306 RepID=UPI00380DA4BB
MKICFQQPAPEGEVFAPDAFDTQVGKEIPIRLETRTVTGRLIKAVVAADGRSADLTVEADDLTPKPGPASFGLR